jgi:hypothetical protein
MGCDGCRFYELIGERRHCIWFEARIKRLFPGWKDKFESGEIKFRGCGFYEPQ